MTEKQRAIMREFYSHGAKKVIFNKAARDDIWNSIKNKKSIVDFEMLKKICPALLDRIEKSFESGNNVQSAVFSECVYAQTLANIFELGHFAKCGGNVDFLPQNVKTLLESNNLTARYVYSNDGKSQVLVQAGGCGGVDSALIAVRESDIFLIEFKEQGAKSSEHDLPKYAENGKIPDFSEFLKKYPQFSTMVREQFDVNFFEIAGNNVHDFSASAISEAISENYSKTRKFADVICTEDIDGFLTMMPANQVGLWAKCEGEIRPAGRNHYNVWTPIALKKFLLGKNAKIDGEKVVVKKSALTEAKERGGTRISRYKINPLFFVRVENCSESGDFVSFDMKNVRQLKPTIAAKMDFRAALRHENVKKHYEM